MGFNVSFSKRDKERFYLPGQEIKVSRGLVSPKSFASENDNVRICRTRTWLLMMIFAAVYSILALRVSYVCLENGIKIDTAISTEQNVDEEIVDLSSPVKRADILDRNGDIIATSLPTVILQADTTKIRDPEEAAARLNELFPEISYETFLKKLKKHGRGVLLRRDLSPAQQYAVNSLGIPGLEFINAEKRIYPQGSLFSHVLGYTNQDNQGGAGLEKFMDERLVSSSVPLQLSLDLGVQNTIRDELLAGMKEFKPKYATAIMMDVNTGRVIAMVSLPDYDPNDNIDVNAAEMFNHATKEIYEPGSVFKVFNTAMALESGKLKMSDKFDTNTPLFFGKRRVKDPHPAKHKLSPEDILVTSSNVGSVLESMLAGKEYQQNFLRILNMDKKLKNFELIETAQPYFENKWSDHKAAVISYGYGISTTPLHIISGFSAVINGGIYHNPTLLKKEKEEGRRIISEKNSHQMRDMLRAVVERGTGKGANVKGYQVIGKTGTANVVINGHYERRKSVSTFISAFPQSNPRYALLVMFHDPKPTNDTFGHTEAGWNVVPITNKIISSVAPQLGVKVDFDLDTQKSIVDAAYKKAAN